MAPSLATLEDRTLIALTLAGQTECFGVLVDRHRVQVRRRIASLVKNAADADDILQEALLKVWRHLSSFRSESSFRTWMTRVAINEALQLFRRQRRSPLFEALDNLEAIDAKCESPHQSMVRVERTQAVHNAVARLREKDKKVLILRDLQRLSERETAQCLNSTVPAVKTRLFRARIMLRAEFQRSEIQGFRARSSHDGKRKFEVCCVEHSTVRTRPNRAIA